MPANEYVQAAAGQLQSGATAIKTEMDQLRADFITYERQTNHDIDDKESEIRALTARVALIDEASEGHLLLGQIRQLKGDVDRLRNELNQRRQQLNNDLRSKEGAMNDLMNQARGLQNKAASLK